jgi:uncharacterized protein (TIGR01319 family)
MATGTVVLVDVGSTYTKAVRANTFGVVEATSQAPTVATDLDSGFRDAADAVLAGVGTLGAVPECDVIASSSAAGGLRLLVLGLEESLTVEAGRQAAMSAGARVVGAISAARLAATSAEHLTFAQADIVLLTGGSSGGDRRAIVAGARALSELAPGLPVVVAGNEEAYDDVRPLLRNRPVVRYLPNVMPAVGELRVGPVQEAIREIFAQHVMGSGRFRSGSALARSVRMPTPAAVLTGVSVLAKLAPALSWLARPVTVDVGGATTDVHSVLADGARRSVEGDLGLRENADSVVSAAREAGLTTVADKELDEAARLRRARRSYLPVSAAQVAADLRLTELACTIALERHAGMLRYQRGQADGFLRATGRDLREATCFIGTGGIFARAAGADRALRSALVTARNRGALVPERAPVITDKGYLIWAIGLLETWTVGAGLLAARTWAADRGKVAGCEAAAR